MSEIVVYHCPACGAPLTFQPESQQFDCEYCGSQFTSDQLDAKTARSKPRPRDVRLDQEENQKFLDAAQSYSCPNCGAQIITDQNTAATFCVFCHYPTVIAERLTGDFAPIQVIPFQFDKQRATTLFLLWCKHKPLLPKDFKSSAQLEKITGVYLPFWLFDCEVDAKMFAQATRRRLWRTGNVQHIETSYFAVTREGRLSYHGVPADGSAKMKDELMDQLEPFDYSALQPFSMSYLAGFLAEKYDVDQNEVFPRIRKRVEDYSQAQLRSTVLGYDSVRVADFSANYEKADASYTLLPVYLLNYFYKGETYPFVLNGQTGKLVGRLPLSKWRAAAWFGAITAAVTAILYVGGLFL